MLPNPRLDTENLFTEGDDAVLRLDTRHIPDSPTENNHSNKKKLLPTITEEEGPLILSTHQKVFLRSIMKNHRPKA